MYIQKCLEHFRTNFLNSKMRCYFKNKINIKGEKQEKHNEKIFAVALVLMMTLPLVAFPVSANEDAQDAVEPLYVVDFRGGGEWGKNPSDEWSAFNEDVTKSATESEGKSIDLKFRDVKTQAAVFGNALDTDKYEMFGSAFTTVFTVTAEDADQEVGFFPDWQSGFVVKPGKNSYRCVSVPKQTKVNDEERYVVEEILASQSYGDENGALTQTYAIEVKDEGTGRDSYNVTVYNLYVAQNGEWVLVCSLTPEQMDVNYFDWFYEYKDGGETLYEDDFTIRFYRQYYMIEDEWTTEEQDTTQDGAVTVTDTKIYKGLAVTGQLIEAPEATVIDPGNDDTDNENTGNENDGNENTGNENTDNENTGNENTGNENNDNGNTDTKDEAPTTEAPKAEEETEAEKSGCGSTLAVSGVALVGACAAMLAIKRRKNEDD